MTQSEWFFHANQFLESLSGKDELGVPKASVLLRIGGGEDSQAIEADLGTLTLQKHNLQGCYMLTFSFDDLSKLRQCTEQFEKYASYVDTVNGAINDGHMLSIVITENKEDRTGYVIGMNPVFFAQTASEPLGKIDSYRIAFRKDCIFYYGVEDFAEEDSLSSESEEDDYDNTGFYQSESSSGIWNGFA